MIAAQFVVPFSDCTNWQRKGSSTFYNSSCLENPSSSRFRKKQKAIRFSWRKSFQHDLYPDTRSTVPALTAEEFMEGKDQFFSNRHFQAIHKVRLETRTSSWISEDNKSLSSKLFRKERPTETAARQPSCCSSKAETQRGEEGQYSRSVAYTVRLLEHSRVLSIVDI